MVDLALDVLGVQALYRDADVMSSSRATLRTNRLDRALAHKLPVTGGLTRLICA